uniref:Uncharacterized protein n=1 Tax=Timema douglasi TaxID=61478 RepID=A0A7R8VHJ0_TIMDO|nr:unnamed protein product [Timema douglasi]
MLKITFAHHPPVPRHLSLSKISRLSSLTHYRPQLIDTRSRPCQFSPTLQEESDSIERLHISASEAFSKFKGKLLDAGVVDFSDRLSKARHTGYDARSGDWELIGEGEKETPRHKLQRLQCEMRELCEELAHRKESVKDEKSQDQKEMVFLANQLEQAEKQLADIKLEEILGTELVANLADPQEAQLKKALSLIEDLKRGGDNFGDAKNVAVLDQKEITFQLNYRPEHARFSQTTRLAELEQRLHKMEAVLGMEPQKLTRLSLDSQRRSLLEVAESLSARANLLDSAQLDHIEGRLIALTQNMDSLAEKTGTCEDADKQRKVRRAWKSF